MPFTRFSTPARKQQVSPIRKDVPPCLICQARAPVEVHKCVESRLYCRAYTTEKCIVDGPKALKGKLFPRPCLSIVVPLLPSAQQSHN